ncbi:hypothetical protein JHK82_016090 [Glycine max]|nr:hypothetical protein JHK85_016488 [Glycine max]KAG5149209.1 hypothetical protein JHK82_016090 [Glycine max]
MKKAFRLTKVSGDHKVAMKTLIIIHRAIRELDTSILEELVNYSQVKGCMIDLSYFHDKSIPNDYSIWIRNYALYLEERLQCFTVMNYDVATNTSVASESVKLYVAITIRVVELLDKFFEMHHNDACSSLQIYQKSMSQAERLTEFFETCKGLEFGKGQKFINIKMPPASFIITMEEYIKEAPSSLMLEYNMDLNHISNLWVDMVDEDTESISPAHYLAIDDVGSTTIISQSQQKKTRQKKNKTLVTFPHLVKEIKARPLASLQLEDNRIWCPTDSEILSFKDVFLFLQPSSQPASRRVNFTMYVALVAAMTTIELAYNKGWFQLWLKCDSSLDVDREEDTTTKNVGSADLLTLDNDVVDKSTDPHVEDGMAIPPPQAAELMGLFDLLTGASEFDEKSLTTTIVPTEKNSKDDENRTSPITGWEVALFSDSERYDENVIAEIKSKEKTSQMEVSKLDSLYDEVIVNTQQSVTNNATQVTSNPFDYEASHNDQFSMVMAPSALQNELCALPHMQSPISTQMVGTPQQHLLQQQNEPYTMNKKSTNPFD